jgi:hypothetical protein
MAEVLLPEAAVLMAIQEIVADANQTDQVIAAEAEVAKVTWTDHHQTHPIPVIINQEADKVMGVTIMKVTMVTVDIVTMEINLKTGERKHVPIGIVQEILLPMTMIE